MGGVQASVSAGLSYRGGAGSDHRCVCLSLGQRTKLPSGRQPEPAPAGGQELRCRGSAAPGCRPPARTRSTENCGCGRGAARGSTALRCPAGAPLAKGLRRQGAEGPPAPWLSCCCCCCCVKAAVAGPLWLLRQLSCQQRVCEPQQLLLEPLHVCTCRGQGHRKQAEVRERGRVACCCSQPVVRGACTLPWIAAGQPLDQPLECGPLHSPNPPPFQPHPCA